MIQWPVLAVAALIASTLAGVTGFGGAAVLLPALILVFGVRSAVPILTVAQLIGNASRVWFNRRDLHWRVVGWFALAGIPMAFVGGLLFARAPVNGLTRVLGAFLLLVVLWRHAGSRAPKPFPVPAFAAIGGLASLLSAFVGSVGPVMAPFFLGFGLVKGAYIGTEALCTVAMHIPKLIAYRHTSVLSGSDVWVGLALGPIMVLGSYLGKRILDRLPEKLFIAIIEGILIAAGLMFLVRGT